VGGNLAAGKAFEDLREVVGDHSMSAFEPVRTVVVGVGEFGRLHARTLSGLTEAQLVGVVDTRSEAVDKLRSEIGQISAWSALDEALQESDADAYVIATHTPSHVALAQQVLQAGKCVLVEKPLAGTSAEAGKLADLVKPDSSNIMAAHILLFSPPLRRLLQEAATQEPITFFQAVRHRPATTREHYPHDNPLRLTMVHDLYVALAMMNAQEPESFSAYMHPHPAGAYDLATAELRWANGTCGSFVASFLTPPGMAADGFDRLEVFAPGWTARLALNPQPFEVWTNKASWPVGLDIHADPSCPSGWLAEELRHFCRVVRGTATVPIGARYQDALQVQRWIEQLEILALR
jgi:predicted dehydrogenase